MGYITIQELKDYPLPVTTAQWAKVTDPQLQIVIDQATTSVDDWLDRSLTIQSYTDRVRGNDRTSMLLECYPIVSLTGVNSYDYASSVKAYDGSFFRYDTKAAIVYWLSTHIYNWDRAHDWEITYTSGLSTIPGPVKYATTLQAVKMLQPIFRGGTNFTEVKLIEGLDSEIVDALYKYKRKRIG